MRELRLNKTNHGIGGKFIPIESKGIFGAISWTQINPENLHPALLCLDRGLCGTALNTDKATDIIEKYGTDKIKAGLESGNSKKK
tara:strand:+ start:2324 stop:2578 length:255 start_codon:yes stop_codon:yes gene_type:complete